MTPREKRLREMDLKDFVAEVGRACTRYGFGIESHAAEVEIYDRRAVYEAGKPFALLGVDQIRVLR